MLSLSRQDDSSRYERKLPSRPGRAYFYPSCFLGDAVENYMLMDKDDFTTEMLVLFLRFTQ